MGEGRACSDMGTAALAQSRARFRRAQKHRSRFGCCGWVEEREQELIEMERQEYGLDLAGDTEGGTGGGGRLLLVGGRKGAVS